MTNQIKGPISPQDAEVIAGWCDHQAAINRVFVNRAFPESMPQSMQDELNAPFVTELALWEERAAAVRAAAREPVKTAWMLEKNDGLWVVTDITDDEAIEAKSVGYRAVRVRITEVPE